MSEKPTNKQTADIGAGKAGPGRPKGSVNKVTADIRAMILGALNAKGGQEYLERQAEANPVAFLSLLGRTVPKELTGPDGRDLIPGKPTDVSEATLVAIATGQAGG